MADTLRSLDIWAMFLDSTGRRLWSVELPADIPADYSVQDVAAFAKGYLRDYPVFIRCREDGLLVLGYPKESYFKITGNYYPMDVVKMIPVFFCVVLAIDLTAMFLAYGFRAKSNITAHRTPLFLPLHHFQRENRYRSTCPEICPKWLTV